MASKKCVKCNKNITKTKPDLVCSRCDKSIHADPACVKLSNKQINTLKNSPGIEWSCENCLQNLSRRSSFLIPDDSDDEFETGRDIQPVDTRKLVQEISRELKKTIREEIKSLEASMEFVTDQLSTMEQSILKQNAIIKDLENKNQDLINKNKNLELRVSKNLFTCLEMAGLPNIHSNEMPKMLENIASKLDVDTNDVRSSSRLPGSKDNPGPILVEMKTPSARSQWIADSKEKCLTVGALMQNVSQEKAEDRVYLREALTKYVKTLFIYFQKATRDEVHKIIKNLNPRKAPGSDNIRVSDIKSIGYEVSGAIADLINCSVKEGTYPDDLKIGCMGKGTSDLLIKFTDEVNTNLNRKLHVCVLFIDFSRAFDTLDHKQLISKLNDCGIRGPLLNWCSSYLQNRTFQVKINDVSSEPIISTEGTAQGSVLGPLHFLSYVNEMNKYIQYSTCYQFADDTCLVAADKDPNKACDMLQ
ncbi:hypothetical protein ABMA27_010026 [Loxostege sticticalis]|uniref:Reverse transcriptase domain-containing protein n=1 Tax=Loxostege sticticalis TaxID=481309 RepID=A0ABR3H7B2_LOXSC